MSIALNFRVEDVFTVAGRGACVMARRIGKSDFQVSGNARLGGVRLRPALDIPRKVKEDGTLDLDISIFQLLEPSDISCFTVGSEVLLEDTV